MHSSMHRGVMRRRWQLPEDVAMEIVMNSASRRARQEETGCVSHKLHTPTSKSGLRDLARCDKASSVGTIGKIPPAPTTARSCPQL